MHIHHTLSLPGVAFTTTHNTPQASPRCALSSVAPSSPRRRAPSSSSSTPPSLSTSRASSPLPTPPASPSRPLFAFKCGLLRLAKTDPDRRQRHNAGSRDDARADAVAGVDEDAHPHPHPHPQPQPHTDADVFGTPTNRPRLRARPRPRPRARPPPHRPDLDALVRTSSAVRDLSLFTADALRDGHPHSLPSRFSSDSDRTDASFGDPFGMSTSEPADDEDHDFVLVHPPCRLNQLCPPLVPTPHQPRLSVSLRLLVCFTPFAAAAARPKSDITSAAGTPPKLRMRGRRRRTSLLSALSDTLGVGDLASHRPPITPPASPQWRREEDTSRRVFPAVPFTASNARSVLDLKEDIFEYLHLAALGVRPKDVSLALLSSAHHLATTTEWVTPPLSPSSLTTSSTPLDESELTFRLGLEDDDLLAVTVALPQGSKPPARSPWPPARPKRPPSPTVAIAGWI